MNWWWNDIFTNGGWTHALDNEQAAYELAVVELGERAATDIWWPQEWS